MSTPPTLPIPGSSKESLPTPFDIETLQGDLRYPAHEYKTFMQDGEQVRMLYHAPSSTLWKRARKYVVLFCLVSFMWLPFSIRAAHGDLVTLFLCVGIFVFPISFSLLYLIPWFEGRTAEKEEFLFTDRRVIFRSGNKRAALDYADVTGNSGELVLYQKNLYSFLRFKTAKNLPGISRLEIRLVPRDHPVVGLLKELKLLER